MPGVKKCSSDSDCVAVQAGCCPCSMGGKLTCISKEYKDLWEDEKTASCGEVACPAVYMCFNMSCSCVNGTCEATSDV